MRLYPVYRVLAYVVGVLLVVCSLISLAKYAGPDGSGLQQFGEDWSVLWAFHGFVYMGYFVVAFLLAVSARWSFGFTIVMLAAGLIPLLMFWVERQVERRWAADRAADQVADHTT